MTKVRAALVGLALLTTVLVSPVGALASHEANPGPYFPDSDVIVDMELYNPEHGWVLQKDGNVRAFGDGTAEPTVEPAFGFNIARALELWYVGLENGTPQASGYVLSGWGDLHRWVTPGAPVPPNIVIGPYWYGWDIARDFELIYDYPRGSEGAAGFVLSGWGSLHPFASSFSILPETLDDGPYWPGWDIARDLEAKGQVTCNGGGEACGLILDGWGGLHPWSTTGLDSPDPITDGPYWPGWDIARDFQIFYGGGGETEGWLEDGWGGQHTWGGAPPIEDGPYWSGWDIARDLEVFIGGGGSPCTVYDVLVLDGWGARHSAHTSTPECT